jgi:hypothetical protein
MDGCRLGVASSTGATDGLAVTAGMAGGACGGCMPGAVCCCPAGSPAATAWGSAGSCPGNPGSTASSTAAVILCALRLCALRLCALRLCPLRLCPLRLCPLRLCPLRLCPLRPGEIGTCPSAALAAGSVGEGSAGADFRSTPGAPMFCQGTSCPGSGSETFAAGLGAVPDGPVEAPRRVACAPLAAGAAASPRGADSKAFSHVSMPAGVS